jgi:HlyD family secretion protein
MNNQSIPGTNSNAENGYLLEEMTSIRPSHFVKWGIPYFLLFIIFIIGICWLIKYPEIINATATLNSINAPKHVLTRVEGKIVKILSKEGEEVKSGQVLAYMESVANANDIMQISNQLDSMNILINENKFDELIKFFPFHTKKIHHHYNLGELSVSYETFIQSFIKFREYLKTGFYQKKIMMLQIDLENLQKQYEIFVEQKKLIEQDLSLSNESYEATESLAIEKVVSPLEYRTEKSKLISKQLAIPQIKSAILSNKMQQNEKFKEIIELKNLMLTEQNSFVQSLQTIKSQLLEWEKKYILKAPIAGRLSFKGFFQEYQEFKIGQIAFTIHPNNTVYNAELNIPQFNFGKVKVGQQIYLKLQAYPSEQYGSVIGKIDFINPNPTDSGYIARAILPNGIYTTNKRELQFQSGLLGKAEIVTKELRLLERFYYNLLKPFQR